MKWTVLKASKSLAEQIAKDLLNRTGKTGRPLYIRAEIEHGFEIKGRLNGVEIVVFRYTNPGGRQRFDYDERVLSFTDPQ